MINLSKDICFYCKNNFIHKLSSTRTCSFCGVYYTLDYIYTEVKFAINNNTSLLFQQRVKDEPLFNIYIMPHIFSIMSKLIFQNIEIKKFDKALIDKFKNLILFL